MILVTNTAKVGSKSNYLVILHTSVIVNISYERINTYNFLKKGHMGIIQQHFSAAVLNRISISNTNQLTQLTEPQKSTTIDNGSSYTIGMSVDIVLKLTIICVIVLFHWVFILYCLPPNTLFWCSTITPLSRSFSPSSEFIFVLMKFYGNVCCCCLLY